MQDDPRLVEALKRADAAGNAEDARRLARAIADGRRGQSTQPDQPFWQDYRRSENVSVAQPAPKESRLSAFSRSATDMATFGVQDELSGALVGAPVGAVKGAIDAVRTGDVGAIPRGIGQEYAAVRDAERDLADKSRRDRPVSSFAGAVGGAALNPISRAGGQFAAGAKTLGGTAARVAATGAVEGGLYGAGSAEGGAGERAQGAAVGAATGAAIGAGATAFLGGVGRVLARRQAALPKMTAPERAGFKFLRDSLIRDKGGDVNAAEATLRIWRTQQNLDPEWLIRNSGDNVRTMIEEISSDNPAPALEFIERMRSANARQVYDAATRSFNPGRKSATEVKDVRDALTSVRRAQAKPLYDAAYNFNMTPQVYDARLRGLMANPEVRRGLGRAQTILNGEIAEATATGDAVRIRTLSDTKGMLANWANNQTEVVLDTRAIDYLTQGMSAREAALRKTDPAIARPLGMVRRAIRDQLSEINPPYRQALDVYSSNSGMLDALEEGRSFLSRSMTVSDVADQLQGMTKVEREMYRVGVAEQLRAQIGSKPTDANPARGLVNDNLREKIRILFQDAPQEGEAFIRAVTQADDFAGRLYDIDPTANSRTFRRQAARETSREYSQRAAGLPGAAEAFVQNPVSAIPRAGTRRIATSARERARAEMEAALRETIFGNQDRLGLNAIGALPPPVNYRPGVEYAAPVAQIPFRQNQNP